MFKKTVIAAAMVLGLSQGAQADMSAGMPNMGEANAQMQKSMALLPFLTAPIESSEVLSDDDVKRFIAAIKEKKSNYRDYSKKIEKGYEKAAEVVQKGANFNTFVKKAIELSGVKSKLNRDARDLGYNDALDLTIKSARIGRAMVMAKMDEEIAKVPKEQQEMMRSMTSGMVGQVKKEDIEVVKPYLGELEKIMKKKQQP